MLIERWVPGVAAARNYQRASLRSDLVAKWLSGRLRREASAQAVYCAELLAITFTRMGLLDGGAPANWFDPGRFWSGDRLHLAGGASLGPEIAVVVDPLDPTA